MDQSGMDRGALGGRRAELRGTERATSGRRGSRALAAALAALLATGGCVTPAVPRANVAPPPAAAVSTHSPMVGRTETALEGRIAASKGWAYLVDRLAASGVDRDRAERIFADPRMPAFDGLSFRVDPREPKSMYREVLQPQSVSEAQSCRSEHAAAFETAERAYGVSADVIAAILHVETRCGRNTGASTVLFGLARLAMANEPDNVEANVQRTATQDGVLDEALADRVRARAAKLEDMFLPEVVATFAVAQAEGVDPLAITGSPSGAFGMPQFLPTSYLRHGADGDGDGRVDLYEVEDAAASAARFLASFGWRGGLPRAEQRQVIWHYNRSDAYIDAVLDLAERITPPSTREASAPQREDPVAQGEAAN